MVVFNNLNMSEASTKHNEREFVLGVTVLGGNPYTPVLRKFSRPFYSYSHKKVLERRSKRYDTESPLHVSLLLDISWCFLSLA